MSILKNLPRRFLSEFFPIEPMISRPSRHFLYFDLESQEVECFPKDCLPMLPIAKHQHKIIKTTLRLHSITLAQFRPIAN